MAVNTTLTASIAGIIAGTIASAAFALTSTTRRNNDDNNVGVGDTDADSALSDNALFASILPEDVCLEPAPGFDDLEAPEFVPATKPFYIIHPSGNVYYCPTNAVRGTRATAIENADIFGGDVLDVESGTIVSTDYSKRCADIVYSDSAHIPLVPLNTAEYLLCPGPGQTPQVFDVDALGFVVDASGTTLIQKTGCYGLPDGTKITLTRPDFIAYLNGLGSTVGVVEAGSNSFAECLNGNIYSVGTCDVREKFSPQEQKCVPTDVCESLVDGAVVAPNKPDDIGKNQWIQCESGKSVVKTCPEQDQLYDYAERRCFKPNVCYGQPDNSVFPGNSPTTYVFCTKNQAFTRNCPPDTVFSTKFNKCVVSACSDENVGKPMSVPVDFPPGYFIPSNTVQVCDANTGELTMQYASDADDGKNKLSIYTFLQRTLLDLKLSPSVVAGLRLNLPFYTVRLPDGSERPVNLSTDYHTPDDAKGNIVANWGVAYYPNLPYRQTAGMLTLAQNGKPATFTYNTSSSVVDASTGRFVSPSMFFGNPTRKRLFWENGLQTSYTTNADNNVEVFCPNSDPQFYETRALLGGAICSRDLLSAHIIVSNPSRGNAVGTLKDIDMTYSYMLRCVLGFMCGTTRRFFGVFNTQELPTPHPYRYAQLYNKEWIPIFADRNRTYFGAMYLSSDNNTAGLQAVGLKTQGTRRFISSSSIRLYKSDGTLGQENCPTGMRVHSPKYPFCVTGLSLCDNRQQGGGPGSLFLRSMTTPDGKAIPGFTFLDDNGKDMVECLGEGWTTGDVDKQFSEKTIAMCDAEQFYNPLLETCVAQIDDICAPYASTGFLGETISLGIPSALYLQNVLCKDGKFMGFQRKDVPRINDYFEKTDDLLNAYEYKDGEMHRILIWTKRTLIVPGAAPLYTRRFENKIVNNVEASDQGAEEGGGDDGSSQSTNTASASVILGKRTRSSPIATTSLSSAYKRRRR